MAFEVNMTKTDNIKRNFLSNGVLIKQGFLSDLMPYEDVANITHDEMNIWISSSKAANCTV